MFKLKKLLVIMLAFGLTISATGCSNSDSNSSSSVSSEVSESSSSESSSTDSSKESSQDEDEDKNPLEGVDFSMSQEEIDKMIKEFRKRYNYDPADVEKIKNIATGAEKPDDAVEATISTTKGDIDVVLYPSVAPKAVENFVTHAKNGYYDGISFHRVINGFMIQSGDPLGDSTGGESIWQMPFRDEFKNPYFNYRGALSMANAGPNTNGSQFFIVQAGIDKVSMTFTGGEPVKSAEEFNYEQLDQILLYLYVLDVRTELQSGIYDAIENGATDEDIDKLTDEGNTKLAEVYDTGVTEEIIKKYMPIVEYYYTVGGTPHLDNVHTVFGYVTKGMDIVDAIAAVEVNEKDKPVEDVLINKITIK